jgi:arsenate reductase
MDFRKNPPTRDQVEEWVACFGAKAMRNTSGGAYRALPEEKKEWDDSTWVEAFTKEPMLIKRPIVVRDGEALGVGFRGSDEDLRAQFID